MIFARQRTVGRPKVVPFGWADLFGPLAVLLNVAVVCIWIRNQGLASIYSGADRAIGSLGLLTGLLSTSLMITMMLMLARIPAVEKAWGHDLLTHRHRWVGFVSFWFMIAHVVAYMVERAGDGNVGRAWWHLFVLDSWMLWATTGTIMIAAVVVLSIRWARRRMRYEPWHLLHLYAYLGMALAFPHQIMDGADFHETWARTFWWVLYLGTLAVFLGYRIVLPIHRSWYHRMRVTSVDVEAPGVYSVNIEGHRLDRLRTESGQFFNWRFYDGPGWSRGNPYTISAAPTDDHMRVTIQAVGDGSARVASLTHGTRVFIEGPFGTMTARRRQNPYMLLIAAGVGITPIRALLEDSPYAPGECTLIYRYTEEEHAIFKPEIGAIAARRGVIVRYLPGHRRHDGSWLPAGPPASDDAYALAALVPDITRTDIFLCGPPPWIRAVRAAARRAGADRRHIHTEDFAW